MTARLRWPFALIVFLLLLSWQPGLLAQPAPGSLPWENPNSGFNNPSSGGTSGTGGGDKIETVITTSGGSRDNGKLVSGSGTDQQKGFVNDFLNNAAEKIKNANGGSGWVWTWQKKWKIGPDGKPMEVKEEWHQGKIGTESKPGQSSGPGGGTSTPAAPPSSGGSPPAAPPKAPPASVSGPGTTGGSPSGPPAGTPAAPPKAPPAAPPSTVKTSAPPPKAPPAAPPPPAGVEVAPPRLPPAEVQLVIQNPVDQREKGYPKNVYPDQRLPVTPLVDKNPPVPEDTRVKITLDFNKDKIREEDLTLIVTDNEGDTIVPKDEMRAYRHIFRVPDLERYTARVNYKHPLTGRDEEIIRITIPVYPLDFKNRSIDADQRRTSNDDPAPGTFAGGSGAAGGGSASVGGSAAARGQGSAAASSFGGGYDSSSSSEGGVIGQGSRADLSDLYADPSMSLVAGPGGLDGDGGSAPGAAGRAGRGANGAGNSGGASGLDGQRLAGLPGANRSRSEQSQGTTAADLPGADASDRGAGRYGSARGRQSGEPGFRTSASSADGSANDASGDSSSAGGDGVQSSALGATGHQEPDGMAGAGASYGAAGSGEDTRMAAAQAGSAQFDSSQDGNATPDRPYLLSLSVKNPVTKAAQSFDFISDPFPTAATVNKNTKLSFALDVSREVDRNSVTIVIFDGNAKKELPLASLGGDVFEHLFAQPTAEAYIWIYGNSRKAPFSYKLSIPVADL